MNVIEGNQQDSYANSDCNPIDLIHDLISRDSQFKKLWGRQRKGREQTGASPSNYCQSIANSLTYKGWNDEEVASALKLNRQKHGDSNHKPNDWYKRTVQRATDWVEQHPAEAQPQDPALLNLAWNHLDCFDGSGVFRLLKLLIETSRDGGQTASLSHVETEQRLRKPNGTIKNWFRSLRKAGCIGIRVRANGTSCNVYSLYLWEKNHPNRSKIDYPERR